MKAARLEDLPASEDLADFGDQRVARGEKASLVRALFNGVAPHYDLMNDLMSAGIHRQWKAALVDALNPAPPLNLVDVAGGTGDITFRIWDRMARRFDAKAMAACRLIVCDPSDGMLGVGRARALDRGLPVAAVQFIGGMAEALPLPDTSQDAYTISFGLRNVTDMDAGLAEARRVLRWGGRFLCLEFGGPVAPALAAAYAVYSDHVIPRLGGMVAGQEDSYRYLVESIRRFPDRADVVARMERAGLARVHARPLLGGIATLYSAWRI